MRLAALKGSLLVNLPQLSADMRYFAQVHLQLCDSHCICVTTGTCLSCRGSSPREPQVETRKQQLLDVLKKHDITPTSGGNTRVYQVLNNVPTSHLAWSQP